MDNANIIDFVAYQEKAFKDFKPLKPSISDDLAEAIQNLITSLRDANPLKNKV